MSVDKAVQRSLETLASEGKIKEKVYGKQKVYAPMQVSLDVKSCCDLITAIGGVAKLCQFLCTKPHYTVS